MHNQYFWSADHTASTSHVRSFNRLPEARHGGIAGAWSNNVNVAVYAGKRSQGVEDDTVELSSPTGDVETPMNRIRAKTTVVLTTSDRINWRDDLF